MVNRDDVSRVKSYLLQLQDNICSSFGQEDSTECFLEDEWQRDAGGGGRTRIITNGDVFEKGGVAFSHVMGEALPASAFANRPELEGRNFEAMGVSVVMHPQNPYVPTSHANFRFFIASKEGQPSIWWFGGGFDLTPYYGFAEDVVHWHKTAKAACDPFGEDIYQRYAKWCDDYFYIPHRQEPRGVGGLFFDDLNQWDFETCFKFLQSTGNSYVPAYQPIIAKRKSTPFGESERKFQSYRRGRYVEFNLVYDRGTLFGLQTGGRVESILMSLPPVVNWDYDWQPDAGSKEAELYDTYLQPGKWIVK